jgi:hypothetical protein
MLLCPFIAKHKLFPDVPADCESIFCIQIAVFFPQRVSILHGAVFQKRQFNSLLLRNELE